ncbi:type VI secretion system (T6SS) VasB/ImpH family protein [Neolewinella xylanilytica]|uniref:Type VI secretion system (T6SS) VasB/ImpH family protein n=1 Tax=Neolewinella xylanilytica TaxID=1514080 RepID=A0A2S6IBF0_9BACT|nr:type VI secretion system baseplate subunit TssG [Neolewinella xylanilytica]PPK88779.1 type VI secretion system (T6SS) VasB/ImpH family protein [Neolewinella xylanilytica]
MKAARLNEIEQVLSRHPARMEFLLAELVNADMLSPEELSIRATSTFARNYRQDIAGTKVKEEPSGDLLEVRTHREGMYDQLPYHLFHRPEPYGPTQKLKSRLAESEAARAREAAARAFFFPFEQVLSATAIKVALQERNLTDAFTSPLYRNLLLKLWPGCAAVHPDRLPLLGYVLPLAHRISGDLELMALCYRSLLLAPVQLAYRRSAGPSKPGEPAPAGTILGLDFTLDGRPEEELPGLVVTVGPLSRQRSEEFLPAGQGTAMLELLHECLVPYEVDVRLQITLQPAEESFRLADDRIPASRLGLTATLTPSV